MSKQVEMEQGFIPAGNKCGERIYKGWEKCYFWNIGDPDGSYIAFCACFKIRFKEVISNRSNECKNKYPNGATVKLEVTRNE